MAKPEEEVEKEYDVRGLQSLFGYGREAHKGSGGVCELCGCGAGSAIDFDLWRQFTVEHIIGQGEGGYLPRIRAAVDRRFTHLSSDAERERLAESIHQENMRTACHFCNSTTSRDGLTFTMEDVITGLPSEPDSAIDALRARLKPILDAKRERVKWKLRSVYRTFCAEIHPELDKQRDRQPQLRETRHLPTLYITAPRPTNTK